MLARVCRAACGRARGHLARGDVEDGLAALGGLSFAIFLVIGGDGSFGICRWWRRGNGEEGALVSFGVADERCDVVVGEERVGEDLGGREPGLNGVILASAYVQVYI